MKKNILIISLVLVSGCSWFWNQPVVCPTGRLNQTGDACEGMPGSLSNGNHNSGSSLPIMLPETPKPKASTSASTSASCSK